MVVIIICMVVHTSRCRFIVIFNALLLYHDIIMSLVVNTSFVINICRLNSRLGSALRGRADKIAKELGLPIEETV